MKEIQYLNIIKNTLHKTQYLGDDSAYLEDLGIYVTHDTLVEDVHFSLKTTNAQDLGYKSIAINLSDLAASASKPLYLTVSLSLPGQVYDTDEKFVKEFYQGVDKICEKYNIEVIGGDLTGSDKIVISICAIGKKVSKYNVSRSYAKSGDYIVVTGTHGDSCAGLKSFPATNEFTRKHIRPEPKIEEGLLLAKSAMGDFALMDSSDGLADALYKISQSSKAKLVVDFNTIPVNPNLKRAFPNEYKDMALWGGEDFELVACVNEETFKELSKFNRAKFYCIGRVEEGNDVLIKDGDSHIIDETEFNKKSYKHFKENP